MQAAEGTHCIVPTAPLCSAAEQKATAAMKMEASSDTAALTDWVDLSSETSSLEELKVVGISKYRLFPLWAKLG